jgi:hypothetical protein
MFVGRGSDFVSGIDNEALDFSQLEDFINSEGSQSNNTYFNESLNSTPTSGKLLNVIVENKRNAASSHSLPESPPDSSSEHPYSPQEGCEPAINPSDNIYTTLGPNMYKPASIINPMLGDNLILGSHIVVAEQNGDQLIENGNLLQDGRMIVSQPDAGLLQERIIMPEDNRQILLSNGDSNQNFTTRTIYKGDDNHLVHLGYNPAIEGNLCEPNLDNMQTVYTNLQSAPKKRKLSQDSPLVKSEPGTIAILAPKNFFHVQGGQFQSTVRRVNLAPRAPSLRRWTRSTLRPRLVSPNLSTSVSDLTPSNNPNGTPSAIKI